MRRTEVRTAPRTSGFPGIRGIITLDDATSAHYSMRFVDEEGTASSLQGMRDVIEAHGLPSSLDTDRGSHYWHTPEAGGKVDRERPTQFGRAMRRLGIEMIPADSPEARGRCERMFSTHQESSPWRASPPAWTGPIAT